MELMLSLEETMNKIQYLVHWIVRRAKEKTKQGRR